MEGVMQGHIGKDGKKARAAVLPLGAMPQNDAAPENKMSRSTVRGTGSTPVLTDGRRKGSESGPPDRRSPGARLLCVDHASGRASPGGLVAPFPRPSGPGGRTKCGSQQWVGPAENGRK